MTKKAWIAVGLAGVVAVGGLASVAGGGRLGTCGEGIGALVVINALELSQDQMKALVALTQELMPLRDEILAGKDVLKEKLIAFQGTPEELKGLLQEFLAWERELVQAFADKALDGIKGILTVRQWERLRDGLGLLSEGGLRLRPFLQQFRERQQTMPMTPMSPLRPMVQPWPQGRHPFPQQPACPMTRQQRPMTMQRGPMGMMGTPGAEGRMFLPWLIVHLPDLQEALEAKLSQAGS
ncbi:MAG: hypothetical protein NUV94_02980 [Candidatus Acetothermia bacterium]|jgi:hypothetical protein|nr:hypothetical protein [Candidatus Acetothermia bacterium]